MLPPDTFVHMHSSLSTGNPVNHIPRCKLLKYFSTCSLLNTTTPSSDSNFLVSITHSVNQLTFLPVVTSLIQFTVHIGRVERLRGCTEGRVMEEQGGLRGKKSCIDQVFTSRHLMG